MKTKKGKALKIGLIVLLAFVVLLVGGFYVYTLDYYRGNQTAVAAFASGQQDSQQKNLTIFRPFPDKDLKTGLIFYPGGKVAEEAYAPLLQKLANEGITCVLVKMPFNLAVFGVSAADSVYGQLPDIQHWYLGGHSLGGAMASSYVSKNEAKLSGLILLAAYPINDAKLPTLVMYGSQDGVLDRTKITSAMNPIVIQGGNHAQFGDYGAQKGDGTATITWEDQQAQTVDAIVEFITANNSGN